VVSCRWRVNGHQADDVRRTPIVRYFCISYSLLLLILTPSECANVKRSTEALLEDVWLTRLWLQLR